MIGRAHHLGIAVRDLEAALVRYRTLGFVPTSIEDVPTESVRVAFLDPGGVRLELLEPLRPEGAIHRFLETRGEGLHHVAFEVEDVHAEMDRLRREGFELVDERPRPGAHGRVVAFVHPRSVHGVLVELVAEASQPR